MLVTRFVEQQPAKNCWMSAQLVIIYEKVVRFLLSKHDVLVIVVEK